MGQTRAMTLIADYKSRVNALSAESLRQELAETEATIADLKASPEMGQPEREAVLGFWRMKRQAAHEALALCVTQPTADPEMIAQAASEALLAPQRATSIDMPCQQRASAVEYKKSLLIGADGVVLFGRDKGKSLKQIVSEAITKGKGHPLSFKVSEIRPAWWLLGKPVRRFEAIAGV